MAITRRKSISASLTTLGTYRSTFAIILIVLLTASCSKQPNNIQSIGLDCLHAQWPEQYTAIVGFEVREWSLSAQDEKDRVTWKADLFVDYVYNSPEKYWAAVDSIQARVRDGKVELRSLPGLKGDTWYGEEDWAEHCRTMWFTVQNR